MNNKNYDVLRYVIAGLSALLVLFFVFPVLRLHADKATFNLSFSELLSLANVVKDLSRMPLASSSVVALASMLSSLHLLIFLLILPLVNCALALLPPAKKVSWLAGIPALICAYSFFILRHQFIANIFAYNAQNGGVYEITPYQEYPMGFNTIPGLRLQTTGYGYLYFLICGAIIVLSVMLFTQREKSGSVQALTNPAPDQTLKPVQPAPQAVLDTPETHNTTGASNAPTVPGATATPSIPAIPGAPSAPAPNVLGIPSANTPSIPQPTKPVPPTTLDN